MRAAVLGSPVAHSLSPVLHRAAYAALGLDWTYDAVECVAEDLASFVAGLDETWAGLSLTMPLKRAVFDVAGSSTDLARRVGAANTLLLGGGAGLADNTDVGGLALALSEAGMDDTAHPVLLGGGATACSAVAALAGLGVASVTAVVRSAARAGEVDRVCRRFGVGCSFAQWPGVSSLAAGDLVISTVPAGAAEELVDHGDAVRALFDVAYAPWPTPLAAAVGGAGGHVVGGFELLLRQAALQVTSMTGKDAPVDAMRAAGTAELTRRASGQLSD